MKKLNRERVIADLRLLAAGANGWFVELDESDPPCIYCRLNPGELSRLAWAVESVWFPEEDRNSVGLFTIHDIEKWSTFETLADAIIAERKRLDAVAKQKASEE